MQTCTKRLVLAVTAVCLFCIASHASYAQKPDVIHWKPASVPGPALFVGTLIRSEKFNNPPDGDYATRTLYNRNSPPSLSEISNACGLEKLIFSVNESFSGRMPRRVILNRVTGEWCEGVEATGEKFLVTIGKNRKWYATKVIQLNGKTVVLPPLGGCLGNIDLKKALKNNGIPLPKGAYGDALKWRVLWADTVYKPQCWKKLSQSMAQKGIALKTVEKLWRNRYTKTGNQTQQP